MTRPRKQRRRDARWLVTGMNAAAAIQNHGQTRYLLPVRSGDHPKRYSAGQRLALKPYVPGPTSAHVILARVERIYVGQVDDTTARELGYEGAETFRLAWVREHDTDWWQRLEEHSQTEEGILEDPMVAYGKVQARFEHRWAKRKLAWLLTFTLDTVTAPRMLAASPELAGSYRIGTDNRWHYVPREDERESDRGYTSTDSRSLQDEKPALTDDEWETHVGPRSRYREWDRLREQKRDREAKPLRDRLRAAQAAARTKGYDIRPETRRLEHALMKGRTEQARQQLALIERRVFPVAA
jgi:hypothetical protein